MTIGQVRRAFKKLRIGGLLVVIGVVTYVMALPSRATEKPTTFAAIVVPVRSAAAQAFWGGTSVHSCRLDASGRFPVTVLGGSGSLADPYAIQTLGAPAGCPVAR